MLEPMGAFFEKRLDGYDRHMMTNIASAEEFYPFTAHCLPDEAGCAVLDLGCGTGLELEAYFAVNPAAKVTGIDLSAGMLATLEKKFAGRSITTIQGSYFEVSFGENCFDAAVSVESLHHFTKEEKIPLYTRLRQALREDGYFILTDYFSLTDAEEEEHRRELARLKRDQGITDNTLYHYDTPLTVEHEREALLAAGFSAVEVLGQWGPTFALKAVK